MQFELRTFITTQRETNEPHAKGICINKFTKNILFDENTEDMIHAAVGLTFY